MGSERIKKLVEEWKTDMASDLDESNQVINILCEALTAVCKLNRGITKKRCFVCGEDVLEGKDGMRDEKCFRCWDNLKQRGENYQRASEMRVPLRPPQTPKGDINGD